MGSLEHWQVTKSIFGIATFCLIFICNQPKTLRKYQEHAIPKLEIDSSLTAGKNVFYYRLLLKVGKETRELYRVKNRDHSIEFKRQRIKQPLQFISYEVYDLPTGVTWNVLFHSISKLCYVTDHYDFEAMGDKLIANSVDFNHMTAKVLTYRTKRIYTIKLKKIWPE
ncbi:hypothetical protein [Mucilaginibacter ginkgonis]|uniref:Uncharacterized protein n=1 Tax=Mucilaginibacter ginkgonis TaxID=2682091 RepID=A0A6I4HXA8_9SPHI|nr:hypothetical protein [Mucilaginibacter ginkgonis]QQL51348.1 hypothetical protein GO620_007860 [Mucilaginibacter ginkgonis]